jgi:hypothetical protein
MLPRGGVGICLLQVKPDCLGFGLDIGAMIGHVGFGSGRPSVTRLHAAECRVPDVQERGTVPTPTLLRETAAPSSEASRFRFRSRTS